jgi:hypothetical protein
VRSALKEGNKHRGERRRAIALSRLGMHVDLQERADIGWERQATNAPSRASAFALLVGTWTNR